MHISAPAVNAPPGAIKVEPQFQHLMRQRLQQLTETRREECANTLACCSHSQLFSRRAAHQLSGQTHSRASWRGLFRERKERRNTIFAVHSTGANRQTGVLSGMPARRNPAVLTSIQGGSQDGISLCKFIFSERCQDVNGCSRQDAARRRACSRSAARWSHQGPFSGL